MRLLMTILLTSSFTLCNAQKITGRLIDDSKQPVAYANVVLQKADSTYLTGTITDENGTFTFPSKGEARLINISYIGYKPIYQQLDKDDLGTIQMTANDQMLQEVVVRGNKPIIKREIDRMVFNVANSPISQGNNVMDLLRQTPLVKVTDNSIGIIGKSGVKVMLNGKMSYLSSSDLVQYLKSLQSDDIASIEVITTPPSRYEAGGNGGLINIVTKKNPNMGWNGSVGLSYTQRSYAGERANAMVNNRTEKSFFSLKVRQDKNKGGVDEAYSIIGKNYTQNSNTSRVDTYNNIGGNVVYEYNLTPSSTIGAVYDFSYGKTKIDMDNQYDYYNHNQLDSTLMTKSLQDNKTIAHTVNLYYDLKLDDMGKKLGLVANYMHHSPDMEVNFTTLNKATDNKTVVREPNNVAYSIFTGEANLELPFKVFKMEAGAKYSNITNNSDTKYFNLVDGNYEIFPGRSNEFDYNEQTMAAYVSARTNLNKYFTIQAGLRYEHTFVKGVTPHSDVEDVKSDYGKLFPTVYLTYKPSSAHNLHVNYARRINRPYFRAVNPFKWYTNPNNVDEGNPSLRPSFADNIEFGYTFKNNLTFIAYYQKEDNAYGQELHVNEDNTTYSTYKNIYNNKQFGMNLNYTLNVLSWWNMYVSGNYVYNNSDVKSEGFIAQNGHSFDYKISNTISFDKDRLFQLYLTYAQNMPYRVGVTYDKSYANFTAGFKGAFMGNNLVFNLFGNDLFRQDLVKREKSSVSNKQVFNNYYDSQYVRLSVTYKWGNKKLKVQKKNIQFNEKNRL